MKKNKISRYDVAEHLRTQEEMAAYLEPALKMQMQMQLLSQKPLVTSHVQRACHR
jgi:DNA-binding phage protein